MNSQRIYQVNKNLSHICPLHYLIHQLMNMLNFISCVCLTSKLIKVEAFAEQKKKKTEKDCVSDGGGVEYNVR